MKLCIEEMAGNVVQHAFKPGEKRLIDLIIIEGPEYIIFRIRDNGTAFNPLTYLSNSREEHFGIKIIRSLAHDFEYRYSMELNNSIIKLNSSLS